MPPKDLGTKHSCFKCGAKFYDLKKPQPICPKCGADQRDNHPAKPPPAERRPKAPAHEPVPEIEEPGEEAEEVFEEADDETAEEDEP